MPNDTIEYDQHWGSLSSLHDPRILSNFTVRPTDILITTPPKAGTTWMQQILHQLRSGGDTTFRSIDDVVPWLERQRDNKSWQEILQYFETFKNPRIFKTHCSAPQTPGIDIARIILTSRDPRDCCVSFYHHINNMTDEALESKEMTAPLSFDEHVDQWLDFAAWYNNVQSWWPYYNEQNVLWLRYQDMKSDLPSCIDQIAQHLQWQISAAEKSRVLEYSSFEWMKANDEKFSSQGSHGKAAFKPGKFIRQGKVGKYHDLMTAEQEERIMSKARLMLDDDCLKFLELDI